MKRVILDTNICKEAQQDYAENELAELPQQLRSDSDFDGGFVHLFVVCDEHGVGCFSARYEDAVESADFCFCGSIYALLENVTFINDGSDAADKISCMNAAIFYASEPRNNCCNFHDSYINFFSKKMLKSQSY